MARKNIDNKYEEFKTLVTWEKEDYLDQVILLKRLQEVMPEEEYAKLKKEIDKYLEKINGLDSRNLKTYVEKNGIILYKDTREVVMEEQDKLNEMIGDMVGKYLSVTDYHDYMERIEKHKRIRSVGYGKL